MVKGISKRVIVIKSPDKHIFDEAIFIVKEDAASHGITKDDILKEAQSVAKNYLKTHARKGIFSSLPAPVFAAFGAGGMALIWILTSIF